MSKVLQEKIIYHAEVVPGIFKMCIASSYIAQNAKPGQFVNIKCSDETGVLLRRPISICSVDKALQTFTVIYQVKGKGTVLLSQKKAGESVDILGPLGKPFEVLKEHKHIAIVGGGIGIFPFLFLLDELKKQNETITSSFLGFRGKENIVLEDEFRAISSNLYLATEDGTTGHKGFVTEVLEEQLKKQKIDVVYTCGPKVMIKRVIEIADDHNVRCQVSLEERMGCGIGACLVCACKTKKGDDWQYSHVCKDGPVFWSNEISLDEKNITLECHCG